MDDAVEVRSELDHVRQLLRADVDLQGGSLEAATTELNESVGAYRIQELVTGLKDAGVSWQPTLDMLRTLEGTAPWTYPDPWAYALALLDHVTPDVTPTQLVELSQAMHASAFPFRVLDYMRADGPRLDVPAITLALDVSGGRDQSDVSDWVLSALEPDRSVSDLRDLFAQWAQAPADASRVLGGRYLGGRRLTFDMAMAVARTAAAHPDSLEVLEALVTCTAVSPDDLEAAVSEFSTFAVPLWFATTCRDRLYFDPTTPEAELQAQADAAYSQAAWQLTYPVPGQPVPTVDDVHAARTALREADRARDEASCQFDPASMRAAWVRYGGRLTALREQGVDLVTVTDETIEWPKATKKVSVRVPTREPAASRAI